MTQFKSCHLWAHFSLTHVANPDNVGPHEQVQYYSQLAYNLNLDQEAYIHWFGKYFLSTHHLPGTLLEG